MATQEELITEISNIIQDGSYNDNEILEIANRGVRKISGGIHIIYPDGTQALSRPLELLLTSGTVDTDTDNPYVSMPSDYNRELIFASSGTNETRVEVFESFARFMSYYPNLDNTNSVVAVVVRGKRLYYQGCPEDSDELTLHYYRKSYDMASVSGSGISFAETDSKISDTGNNLAVFYAGQTIQVTKTTNNNGEFTVETVATDGSYITVEEALTDEAARAGFTIKSDPDGIPEDLHEDLIVNYTAWQIYDQIEDGIDARKINTANYRARFMEAMIDLNARNFNQPESTQFIMSR